MTVKELITQLLELSMDDEVWIEQTNDRGPEKITEIEVLTYNGEEPDRVILNGDLFQ